MKSDNSKEELKKILENLKTPEKLNNHPWVKSIIVQTEIVKNPEIKNLSPGKQLVFTLVKLFSQLIPSTDPKKGKRIDSRWAQFGILAAQYFAPVAYGSVFPTSLRDACGRIDEAICSFIFQKPGIGLTEEELNKYQLIGEDAETIPVSTLSDWNSTAIIKLSEIIDTHEQFLFNNPENNSTISNQVNKKNRIKLWLSSIIKKMPFLVPIISWIKRHARLIITLFLILGLTLLGIKAWKIYKAFLPVKEDLKQIQNITQLLDDSQGLADIVDQVQIIISKTTTDLDNLQLEAKPLMWISPAFFWLPKYGEDISHADDLLNYAYKVTLAVNLSIGAGSSLIDQITQEEMDINITDLINSIKIIQSQLTLAKNYLDEANASLQEVDITKLSNKTKGLLDKVIPYVDIFNDGLSIAAELPKVLGSSEDGPKTYIVLIQNSDELRATGGFITGVATIVIEDGKILTFNVEDSYAIDNIDQYYPPAPWQLERYMNAYHWVFRDSNWSPDFPTAAKWAEMFVATGRNYSVDGVIAVDQESLRFVLKALGPIRVDGASHLITAENVIQYMRQAKNEVSNEDFGLHRKDFMADLTKAILQKLKSGDQIPWITLGNQMLQALNERHILIQIDSPNVAAILKQHNWDGSIKNVDGDFLLVVNSNIGFTKVNAVVDLKIKYEVNITNIDLPIAKLSIVNTNNAIGNPECNIVKNFEVASEFDYESLINLCYMDYLRVYKNKGDVLVDSSPHSVPAAMLPWNEEIPAKVDNLLEDNTGSISGYGTLLFVPGNTSVETNFTFELPKSVVQNSNDSFVYLLYIQKQSGTNAIPVEIAIQLPEGAINVESSIEGTFQDNRLIISTTLLEDIDLTVTYKIP